MDKNLNSPLVSVIMPVYNCEPYIAEALNSVLRQTYSNFEIIVIDDLSTDNTRAIVGDYKDARIRLIEKKEHTGLIASLNFGIENSKGAFLARMDGDDVCHPLRLEMQVIFLNSNPDIVVCGTWYEQIPLKTVVRNPTSPDEVRMALLEYCALGHPTVMIRKDFILNHQLFYDSDFFAAEDYDLWTRIAALGKMGNIPHILVYYRSHSCQVSAREQPQQVKNSNKCRARMLCYPLPRMTEADQILAEIIVRDKKISELKMLVEAVDWLEMLAMANAVTIFYSLDEFNAYIRRKKTDFVRRFYLNTTSYYPKVLFEFLKVGRFRQYFSTKEQINLALKCLLFWK